VVAGRRRERAKDSGDTSHDDEVNLAENYRDRAAWCEIPQLSPFLGDEQRWITWGVAFSSTAEPEFPHPTAGETLSRTLTAINRERPIHRPPPARGGDAIPPAAALISHAAGDPRSECRLGRAPAPTSLLPSCASAQGSHTPSRYLSCLAVRHPPRGGEVWGD
jgi:hypothetical protein